MKIKILKPRILVGEFVVNEYDIHLPHLRFNIKNKGFYNTDDCVITELPESFCVKRCDDNKKWYKYLEWLVKQKNYSISIFGRVFVGVLDGVIGKKLHYDDLYPFGTEIHIDDMIKHIDYMERHIKCGEQFHKESQLTVNMNKEFDLTTVEGRLAYAKKHYPIGTKYIPLSNFGYAEVNSINAEFEPRIWVSERGINNGIEVSKMGLIYHGITNKWAEIVKEEINMETQKLSRQGLKEIHSVACSTWKILLEQYGSRNPLENYIELSQEEVNNMFDACTKEQLPIVSKYLKQDDGSVDLSKIDCEVYLDSQIAMIEIRNRYEYCDKAFWLTNRYDWEIKKDSKGQLCLIPTKKK